MEFLDDCPEWRLFLSDQRFHSVMVSMVLGRVFEHTVQCMEKNESASAEKFSFMIRKCKNMSTNAAVTVVAYVAV